jgi:predicted aspartyl protease
MQTANGTTVAKIGLLQELRIAGETIEQVEVAFIPDALLGKNSLLGMSVLGRYQLNIDDQSQLITLFKK